MSNSDWLKFQTDVDKKVLKLIMSIHMLTKLSCIFVFTVLQSYNGPILQT